MSRVSLGLGGLAVGVRLCNDSSPIAALSDGLKVIVAILCLVAVCLSPFAAIGALLSNTKRGLAIGGVGALIASVIALMIPTIE
jgi:hypothetical protein